MKAIISKSVAVIAQSVLILQSGVGVIDGARSPLS